MTTFALDDLIVALASPPGPGERGIVRVSGPGVAAVLEPLFVPDRGAPWRPTIAAERYVGTLSVDGLRVPVPVALHLWPGRRSYTGQPTAELHLPGSPPLLEAVLDTLHGRGARPARPGEFTLRAFLAGRVDLTQAEAVLGVIDAHDHRELDAALRQLAGGLSGRVAATRSDLLDLLADLEAGLDFVEEDIEFVDRRDLIARLRAAAVTLGELLAQADARTRSTGRARVVLAGLPNAGKSSLFNRLVGAEAALVSDARGTTRDSLSAELDWRGTPVELVDTAGWEFSPDELMRVAQSLRGDELERADLVLFCVAADADDASVAASEELAGRLEADGRVVLRVRTKSDLAGRGAAGMTAVSARRGSGFGEMVDAAAARLGRGGGRQFVGTTAARCRESLAAGLSSLESAVAAAESDAGEEIVAAEIREALDQLGRVVGAVYTDDVLDRIFSRFCIGK